MENMFCFLNKIIIFRLRKTIYEARMYSLISFMKLNFNNLETANHIVHVIYVLYSAMKTHL